MSRPPNEFIGRARVLRTEIEAEADRLKRAQEAIFRAVAARLVRYPRRPLRPALAEAVARRWAALPPAWRLACDGDVEGRGGLRLRGCWVVSARYRHAAWGDDDEAGIGIAAFDFSCATTVSGSRNGSRQAVCEPVVLAELGLHALARWLERNPDRDRAHEALLRDLAGLAKADAAADAAGLWPCRSGAWKGERAAVRVNGADHRPIRLARTYLDADALPDAPAQPPPLRRGEAVCALA